jgi:hypothetical protein
MAKAGLFLPQAPPSGEVPPPLQERGEPQEQAGSSAPGHLPQALLWFDRVLADLGDGQSLQQSLSTFSGHVRRIRGVLAAVTPQVRTLRSLPPAAVTLAHLDATPYRLLTPFPVYPSPNSHSFQSLVLLDEVGSGTDPAEGAALASALLEQLQHRAALTYATTHHAELKVCPGGLQEWVALVPSRAACVPAWGLCLLSPARHSDSPFPSPPLRPPRSWPPPPRALSTRLSSLMWPACAPPIACYGARPERATRWR